MTSARTPLKPDDHRALADAHELAHRHAAAEHDVVADRRHDRRARCCWRTTTWLPTLQSCPTCEPTMKKQWSPTSRHAAVVLGAGIHGDVFADIAIGADHEPGRTAAIVHRLRRRAERGEGMDDGARADRGVAGEVDVRDAAGSRRRSSTLRADHAIGADRNVACRSPPLASIRAVGSIMARAHASAIMAPTSASATIWPATLASPRYHHMICAGAILVM